MLSLDLGILILLRTSWDGVEGTIEDKSDWNRGYCTHSQVLFGTWHRPYLVLFEVSHEAVTRPNQD